MQGRVEDLERQLREQEDRAVQVESECEQARREYQTESRHHGETKQALTRALDDLDAWEEERATLVTKYMGNQSGWERERQGLLDTQVALSI